MRKRKDKEDEEEEDEEEEEEEYFDDSRSRSRGTSKGMSHWLPLYFSFNGWRIFQPRVSARKPL